MLVQTKQYTDDTLSCSDLCRTNAVPECMECLCICHDFVVWINVVIFGLPREPWNSSGRNNKQMAGNITNFANEGGHEMMNSDLFQC